MGQLRQQLDFAQQFLYFLRIGEVQHHPLNRIPILIHFIFSLEDVSIPAFAKFGNVLKILLESRAIRILLTHSNIFEAS